MTVLTDLRWWDQLADYTPEQRKLLVALSDEKYKWRTEERLLAVTGLDPTILQNALSQLISQELIRPSMSKKRNIIYGLRERVD